MTNARAERTADKAAADSFFFAATPLITVAICTRNRAGFLEQAVRSVLPQITGDTDVLIVDNASTDETPTITAQLKSLHSCVSVCREPELGLSAARNTALARARGQYVIFLDDDAVAEPGWLAAYRGLLGKALSVNIAAAGGAVFPRYETALPVWLDPRAHEHLRGFAQRDNAETEGQTQLFCRFLAATCASVRADA